MSDFVVLSRAKCGGILYQVFKLTDESAILPCHKSKQFYLSSLRLFNLTSRMWRCIILLPGLKMIDESAILPPCRQMV